MLFFKKKKIIINKFKWKYHIENLQKKLRKSIFVLYHLGNCATYDVLRQAYFSLAESYIRHGITAWGNVKYNSTLQKTQNSLLKILWKKHQHYTNNNLINTNESYTHDTINLAKSLNVLNIKNIYYTTIIKEFDNDTRFLKPIDHAHNTRIRSQGRFKVERFFNEYGRNTLPVALPTILNKIPTNIMNIKNNYKKYNEIKKYLISLQ